jgi:chromosomal replication initiation ATPase DnaA
MDIANARLEAITYQRVEETLRSRKNRAGQRLYNLAALAAYRAHFTVEDFQGPERHRPIAWARQDFMLSAERAGYSLSEIGRFLNRDHTTVLHGIRAAKKREAAQ